MKVAVVGLGSMGMGAALSLLRAGTDVAGCDLAPGPRAAFAAAGGQATDDVAHAARGAGALVIMVVNAAQSAAVLAAAAPVMAPGAVVISCATMSPGDARALAAAAGAAGLGYLDAPVSGGALRAQQGQITVMASGSPAARTAAQPVLDAIAATVHDLGPEPGTGAAFKVVNQLLAGVHIAAACEAMALAARMGLDLAQVYQVITGSAGNSWMFENRVPHILNNDYHPHSAVDIFVKDLGIVAAIGQQSKFPMPVAGTALQQFLAASAAGMGRDDDASLFRLAARIAGLDVPGLAEGH